MSCECLFLSKPVAAKKAWYIGFQSYLHPSFHREIFHETDLECKSI